LGKKRLEAIVNLSQFPENRNQQNRDYEKKKLGNHLLAFRARIGNAQAFYYCAGVIRTNVSDPWAVR
jgi:hypothetical protein